jgi:hypothetical protein
MQLSIIRTVITTMLIALITLATTVGSALAAQAGPTTLPVPAGGRSCLPLVWGNYKVHGAGSSNRGVRFSLHRSADGVNFSDVAQSADTAVLWNVDIIQAARPKLFSGWFKLCARNLSNQDATVTLTLQTDVNAP